ncbi:Lebercilin-like protein [Hondaea fermentalgiana]|uniref:Lebercilin-like protein n=1 Tax=Hondaea fermentalgiana TaxID=2315210 RepID=A0A2R5FYY2_9STRA|nr:Lebercilin-like protein [Hondaea fermentalgiana]|eukprot:GBG23966.1 Lebercilin-like protein [Hondaea fermentalgiana]
MDDDSGEYSQEDFEDEQEQQRRGTSRGPGKAARPEDYDRENIVDDVGDDDDDDDDNMMNNDVADDYEEELGDSSEDDEASVGMGEQERIEKLRLANEVLRKQLKDFARVFEVTMNSKGAGAPGLRGSSGDNGKRSLRAIVQSKQKQVQTLQKKLENYKKSNQQLKRQMKEAFTTDRVLLLTNEVEEKQRTIDQLVEENKGLQALQRSHVKRIAKQQESRGTWSSKLTNLQEELRVARETLRKYRDKTRTAEEDSKRHREHIMKLTDRNKDLKSEIRRYEAANGKAKTRDTIDAEQQQAKWDTERQKLEHTIQILEKSNKQERVKAHQAAKQLEIKVREHETAIAGMRGELEQREKDMRYQLVQIKKLKRGLRELAMGDAPLPVGDAPWSTNMHKFLTDDGVLSPASSPGPRADPYIRRNEPDLVEEGQASTERRAASPAPSPSVQTKAPGAATVAAVPRSLEDEDDAVVASDRGSVKALSSPQPITSASTFTGVSTKSPDTAVAPTNDTSSSRPQDQTDNKNDEEVVIDEIEEDTPDSYSDIDEEKEEKVGSKSVSAAAQKQQEEEVVEAPQQSKSAFAKPMMKSKKKKKKF